MQRRIELDPIASLKSQIRAIKIIDPSGLQGDIGLDHALFKLSKPSTTALTFTNGILTTYTSDGVTTDLSGFSRAVGQITKSNGANDIEIKYDSDMAVTADADYTVTISDPATTFTWTKDGGTPSLAIAIVPGEWQLLDEGVSVRFGVLVASATWSFTVTPAWYLSLDGAYTAEEVALMTFTANNVGDVYEIMWGSTAGLGIAADGNTHDVETATLDLGINLSTEDDLSTCDGMVWSVEVRPMYLQQFEFIEALPYKRFAEVRDFSGTTARPTSISDFYKLPRFNLGGDGIARMETYDDATGTWSYVTGVLNTLDLRSFSMKQTFDEIFQAYNETKAIKGVVHNFTIEYNNVMNSDFSTYEGNHLDDTEVTTYGS